MTTLGELALAGVLEFSDGYRTKRTEHALAGYRILRAGDVREGRIHPDGPDFVDERFASAIGAKVAQVGDVVLTTKGTVGRTGLVTELADRVVYSPQVCYFRSKRPDVVDLRFFYQWLNSPAFVEQAGYLKSSTDMAPYISLKDLASTTIELPSVPTQRAIAEVLGALDDKIAVNGRVGDATHELAATLFRRVYAESPEEGSLGDLIELKYGKALPATQRREGSVLVYGSGGVSGTHDVALCEGPGIVVGRKGTMGAVHWVDYDYYPIDTTYYVEPLHGEPLEYLYFLLRALPLADLNSDSAVPGLNRVEALAQRVKIAEPEHMKSFGAEASILFGRAKAARGESRKLAELRDTLLPHLMSGRITVREAEEQIEQVP